ncbi:MAG TPA: hypothetical protein VI455_07840 [Terriglobia bacterium]
MILSPAPRRSWLLIVGLLFAHNSLLAQTLTVTGHVTVEGSAARARPTNNSGAVVWLTPLGETELQAKAALGPFKLVQKNKQFIPHVLVVPVGAVVEFPNHDPFFHNVFSLFDGKRFDLGLYEAGTTRNVHFNAPGISYIFCNIHPAMSAVVITTKAPYYAISNAAGDITIDDVPPGRYQLSIWQERCLPDLLRSLSRAVVVSPTSSSLGELRLAESGNLLKHKNLYGLDYELAAPQDSTYAQP